MKNPKRKKVQLRLNQEEHEKLKQRAKNRDMTMSAYILLKCTVLPD
jgi:hypothetical protein